MIESLLIAYLLAQPPATACDRAAVLLKAKAAYLADIYAGRAGRITLRVVEHYGDLERAWKDAAAECEFPNPGPCDRDRAFGLTRILIADTTALLSGVPGMTAKDREYVERELRRLSVACKERGDGK